jgi:quercetin dioxygenase-like cupin family protein
MSFQVLKELPAREYLPGFHGRMLHTEGMTLAFWNIEAGAELPEHHHVEEQVANVLQGRFELTVGGETRQLGAGEVAIIPSNVPHSGRALTDCELLDVFQPVREAYRGPASADG